MKQFFAFALIALTATSCQINVMQPHDDGTTVVPDINARIARKLSVGGLDGKTVHSEERYEYNANGQVSKISRLYRSANGQLELYNYEVYDYTGEHLQKLTTYALQQGKQPFITALRRYEYPNANTVVEQMYAVNSQSEPTMLTSRLETTLDQGRKARSVSYYNSNGTMTKSYEMVYRYEMNRLVAQETIYPSNNTSNVFRYAYKGQTAKIEEFMGNRPESISEQSLQYDSRGRLTRSEVTKMNPLLCVAFTLGSATVYEYVD